MKQYKRTYTLTLNVTPELIHTLNEKYFCYEDFHMNEDPDALTEYETAVLIDTLDELADDAWAEGWDVDSETTSKMS